MNIAGYLPSGARYAPPDTPLRVLYRDESLLLVDKPSGLLAVPGKRPGLSDCLETRVRAIDPQALPVHRLDMDTSGITVFARSRAAQRHLARQFEHRTLRKSYMARVWGRPEADSGRIALPLRCDWPRRPLQMVCYECGKASLTDWAVVAPDGFGCRMRVIPRTGRSHQIRVHLKEIGHPILGDRFYAAGPALAAASRLQLHAEALELRHPLGGRWMRFRSVVPF